MFLVFEISEMHTHKAFPELAMVWNERVQEFMHNNVIPQVAIQFKQVTAEIQAAAGRAGSPLVLHWASAQTDYLYIELFCPMMDAGFKDLFVICQIHHANFGQPSPAA